jgi:Sec-independent protein translocase protein TatA
MQIARILVIGAAVFCLSGCSDLPSPGKSHLQLIRSYNDALTKNERAEIIEELKAEKATQEISKEEN